MGTSKVLVVDDDPEVLDLMAEFLRGMAIEVCVAGDSKEALEVFGAERPPLVVTDLKMPGMDGLELMKAIKETSPRTEIVIITAHADVGSAAKAVQEGAFAYLPKPFTLETMGRPSSATGWCSRRKPHSGSWNNESRRGRGRWRKASDGFARSSMASPTRS